MIEFNSRIFLNEVQTTLISRLTRKTILYFIQLIEEEKFALIISAKFSLQCRVKATDHVMIPDFFYPVKEIQ